MEPGEIETVIGQHTDVRKAAVVVRTLPSGDKQLVAYFVPASTVCFSFLALKGISEISYAHSKMLLCYRMMASQQLMRQPYALISPQSWPNIWYQVALYKWHLFH